MKCTIGDMRSKEVINIADGARLGYVHDVEFDIEKGTIESITILGAYRFFGLFGREDDVIIGWRDIKKIGDDIIIIDAES